MVVAYLVTSMVSIYIYIVRKVRQEVYEQRTCFDLGLVLGDNDSNGNIQRLCHGVGYLDRFCLRLRLATLLFPGQGVSGSVIG